MSQNESLEADDNQETTHSIVSSFPHGHSYHEEYQYLSLIRRILTDGSIESTRNGNTKCVFGNYMRFTLRDGTIPLLTSKRVAWRTCFTELLWFLRGETNNTWLQERRVHIWDGNSTREFLDEQHLYHYPEGMLGPIYGWQWRTWNKPYVCENPENVDTPSGIDQLKQVIDSLKDPLKRSSRRLLVSAWNPSQLHEMALPPCHVLFQFHVREGKYLSCALYQRSGDVGLGVPFNIASYSLLTHLMANHCGLIADEFVYFLGNAHIYECHIPALEEQLTRENNLYDFPKINIKTVRESIEYYTIEDIDWIVPYTSHKTIPMTFIP